MRTLTSQRTLLPSSVIHQAAHMGAAHISSKASRCRDPLQRALLHDHPCCPAALSTMQPTRTHLAAIYLQRLRFILAKAAHPQALKVLHRNAIRQQAYSGLYAAVDVLVCST